MTGELATGHGEHFPPLDDTEAQRWWLGGFGAAWALGRDERPVKVALAAALRGREALREHLDAQDVAGLKRAWHRTSRPCRTTPPCPGDHRPRACYTSTEGQWP